MCGKIRHFIEAFGSFGNVAREFSDFLVLLDERQAEFLDYLTKGLLLAIVLFELLDLFLGIEKTLFNERFHLVVSVK